MKHFLVPAKGAVVSFVNADSGEVVHEIPVSAGLYPLARFAPFRGPGQLMLVPGLVLLSLGNMETCLPVGQFESSANPFFRVSPAQRQVREIRRMMCRTEALARRTEAAATAMARAKADLVQLPPPASDGDAALSAS